MTAKDHISDTPDHPPLRSARQGEGHKADPHDREAALTHLIDPWFWHHKRRYLGQCGLAVLCVLVVLFILRSVADTAVIVGIGASSFIVFALPHTRVAGVRCVVGGYVVGVAVGTACHWLEWALPLPEVRAVGSLGRLFYGSLAVGLAMFLMVVTNAEHPPAASIALGLVLEEWSWLAVSVALGGAVVLSMLRKLFLRKLANLL